MTSAAQRLTCAGLFAGIGGIELGLHASEHRTVLLCENMEPAERVLGARFPGVALHDDVKTLAELPACDLVSAGFPCQDLSQAGRTAGITGERSGLVGEVFRLLDQAGPHGPTWLLLENVPFMLQLDRGRAMDFLTAELGRRGYRWAYRVVDTRAFGLPQRRQRVILLASRTEDPRPLLFAEEAGEPAAAASADAYGFYWTEGLRGLGLATDAVPTLKGGSTIGIPSPPAIWLTDRPHGKAVVTPDIRDAERLQGFPAGWTEPAADDPAKRNGPRWKLVGNAVSVPVAAWVGERLASGAGDTWSASQAEWPGGRSWPSAAWGHADQAWSVAVSMWPRAEAVEPIAEFLRHPPTPLSVRAASGFHSRALRSTLRFPPGLLDAVAAHVRASGGTSAAPDAAAA